MTPFILVHGAWHGAWCWERVVPLLAVRGFTARAIDLPGHGDDPTPPGRVSWEDYLERMGEALAAVAGPAILVGHSLGGGVITGAADRWPEKIRALVYLCALLPDAPDAASRFRATRAITSGVRTAPDGSAFEVDREVLLARSLAELCVPSLKLEQARRGPAGERSGLRPSARQRPNSRRYAT